MSNYIGVRCPVCNKKFTSADDIVVCPVCGAPHHRDCYAGQGQCVFAADHITGKEWHAPGEPSAGGDGTQSKTKPCPKCHAPNPAESIYCQICGTRMTPTNTEGEKQWQEWSVPGMQLQIDPITMAYGGLSPEEKIDDIPVQELAQYVGSSAAYYLPRFKVMSETGRTLSVNIAALFFNFFYYFYRKMYWIGGLLLALFVVSTIPSVLYAMEELPHMLYEMGLGPAAEYNSAAAQHFLSLSNMTRSINLVIGMIISLCANRFYYSQAVGTVEKLRAAQKEQNLPQEKYNKELTRAGGGSKVAVGVVVASLVAAYFITSCVMSFVILML